MGGVICTYVPQILPNVPFTNCYRGHSISLQYCLVEKMKAINAVMTQEDVC